MLLPNALTLSNTSLLIFVVCLCKLILALAFATASFNKLRHFQHFINSINSFEIGVKEFSLPLAITVVLVELSSVVLIIFTSYSGFLFVLGVLSLFTGFLIMMLQHRKKVACNCFGVSEHAISRSDIIRNLVLIGFVLSGFISQIIYGRPIAVLNVPLLTTAMACGTAIMILSIVLNLRLISELLNIKTNRGGI